MGRSPTSDSRSMDARRAGGEDDHPNWAANFHSVDRVFRHWASLLMAVALTVFVLLEVIFAQLSPLKQISLFVTSGLILCFLQVPAHPALAKSLWLRGLDLLSMLLSILCCGYLLYEGNALGQRAALYTTTDLWVGTIGLILILEAARRTVGWSLPILAIVFMVYAHQSVAQQLPDWMFPHRGQDWESIIGQTYLRTQGVFGTAASVMFRYVFLFVVFGALLQASGATEYIIGIAVRIFGKRAGGPAKIAVIASGLMGSLSGSAVANAATTGAFTIPLMKNIGFKPHEAAGVEAAASSGGALVPPVMGAGAYMMMEIINPPVTYLQIMQAALIPAILYYLSIFLLVHFSARRIDSAEDAARGHASADEVRQSTELVERAKHTPWFSFAGLSFVSSLTSLLAFMIVGFSPYRAVAYATAVVVLILMIDPNTKVQIRSRVISFGIWALATVSAFYWAPFGSAAFWGDAVGDALIIGMAALSVIGIFSPAWSPLLHKLFRSTAAGSIPLIVAAATVGVIVGMVSRTGIGTAVPQAIIPLAAGNLFLGLMAIMTCSLVLGMGVPSAVSYLLLATIIGPVFAEPQLGVPILAAHMFIFYFGMMAMVTPPVALAAYATASIAQASVFWSSVAAFRYSLVGFTLPFMFVYRPALLLMNETGGPPVWSEVVIAIVAAVLGILALSSAMSGFLFYRLTRWMRVLLLLAASSSLFPDQFGLLGKHVQLFDVIGGALLGVAAVWNWRSGQNHSKQP
ncbi:MAG: TRAP transporter fused permease subunit [Pirellulaceae bacterium]|nr:TRAP transporter fused permease subunit [Pirellulaceae bacterium]